MLPGRFRNLPSRRWSFSAAPSPGIEPAGAVGAISRMPHDVLAEKQRVRDEVLKQKARELSKQKATDLAAKLKNAPDFDKTAKAAGVEPKTTELITRDPKAAESFYKQLFGWSSKVGTDGGVEYRELGNAGRQQAGIMALRPEMGNMPPAWTPYFGVENCDAAAAKATQLGGRVYVQPTDIPKVGRFAVLADPQGAVFDVYQPART